MGHYTPSWKERGVYWFSLVCLSVCPLEIFIAVFSGTTLKMLCFGIPYGEIHFCTNSMTTSCLSLCPYQISIAVFSATTRGRSHWSGGNSNLVKNQQNEIRWINLQICQNKENWAVGFRYFRDLENFNAKKKKEKNQNMMS